MAENHLSFYRGFCILLRDNKIQDKPKSRIGLSITIGTVSFYMFLYVLIMTWHKYGTNNIISLYFLVSTCLMIVFFGHGQLLSMV